MQKSTMRWDDLRVFLAVARRGRLQAAGRTLGLDPTTAGRRIAALEAALGTALFERSARGLCAHRGRARAPRPCRGDGGPGARGGGGRARRGGASLGHGAHRRAGRGVELPPRRRLRHALPRQPRAAGAGRRPAADLLALQARGGPHDHRGAAGGGAADGAQGRRLRAGALRERRSRSPRWGGSAPWPTCAASAGSATSRT